MNTVKIDMATIAKAFGEFNGTEEDVVAWLNNCQAVAKLTALPEDYQLFALVAALKGRARLWFTSASAAVTTWELDTFKIRLKARFSASEHNRKILEKFQAIRIANNRTEFKELIDLSTEIYSRDLVNMAGLYEQFISRIPSTVSNHELRVKGKIKGLKISIQGKERTINAIVTENLPGIIIIGADSIMRYSDLLTHIVESETGKPTPHKKKKHYLQRNRKKLRRDDNKQISRYIQNRTIRYESMHNNKS